jgi:hypothetical protein
MEVVVERYEAVKNPLRQAIFWSCPLAGKNKILLKYVLYRAAFRIRRDN